MESPPFCLLIKKAPGIVTITEDFHKKWNEILKGTERNLTELLLVKSEKVIAKIQLEIGSKLKLSRRCRTGS